MEGRTYVFYNDDLTMCFCTFKECAISEQGILYVAATVITEEWADDYLWTRDQVIDTVLKICTPLDIFLAVGYEPLDCTNDIERIMRG